MKCTSWGLSGVMRSQQNAQAWGESWASVSHLWVSWGVKTE